MTNWDQEESSVCKYFESHCEFTVAYDVHVEWNCEEENVMREFEKSFWKCIAIICLWRCVVTSLAEKEFGFSWIWYHLEAVLRLTARCCVRLLYVAAETKDAIAFVILAVLQYRCPYIEWDPGEADGKRVRISEKGNIWNKSYSSSLVEEPITRAIEFWYGRD